MGSKPSACHTALGDSVAWGSGVPSTAQSADKDGVGDTVVSFDELSQLSWSGVLNNTTAMGGGGSLHLYCKCTVAARKV